MVSSALPENWFGRIYRRPQLVGELLSAARVSGGHEWAGEHRMSSSYRSVPLAGVSIIAGIGWVLFIVLLWSQAERGHDHRRQVRLLMIAESTARIERDQLRQAAGTLADLQAKSAAAMQDLAAATEARARLAPQLADGERTVESQRSRLSELARTGDDLFGSVRQLEARLAQTKEALGNQQAELAALRDAVTSEKQTLADLKKAADEARATEALVHRAIAERRSEQEAVEHELEPLRAELAQLKSRPRSPEGERSPAPLDPELTPHR
jgi:DNA repair exonuclease SbcCD ATPase subunit